MIAHPEVLVQLRTKLVADVDGFNVPEDKFFQWAMESAYKWLNRRGGKRKSFTWPAFAVAMERLGIAKPRITERSYARRVFT